MAKDFAQLRKCETVSTRLSRDLHSILNEKTAQFLFTAANTVLALTPNSRADVENVNNS